LADGSPLTKIAGSIVDFFRDPMHRRKAFRLLVVSSLLAAALAALVALHFPYDTDTPPSAAEVKKAFQFYQREYEAPRNDGRSAQDEVYFKVNEESARDYHIKEDLESFVQQHGLKDKKALDVGAGSGYLQDVVADYTGLDISSTAKRFFKKPFVLGSATALPFRDNEFDILWSVWVLEHVPNPEQALREMRRVVKPNGFIYLRPTWNCVPWRAKGYDVRPYSDFDLKGKIIKASIPLRSSPVFHRIYALPIRSLRVLSVWAAGSPSTLHYRRLIPNYEKYWGPDSDALNSIDSQETYLWFASRGDECLDWPGPLASIFRRAPDRPLIIRVKRR
jgi:SAM-dependent methyltransferase